MKTRERKWKAADLADWRKRFPTCMACGWNPEQARWDRGMHRPWQPRSQSASGLDAAHILIRGGGNRFKELCCLLHLCTACHQGYDSEPFTVKTGLKWHRLTHGEALAIKEYADHDHYDLDRLEEIAGKSLVDKGNNTVFRDGSEIKLPAWYGNWELVA